MRLLKILRQARQFVFRGLRRSLRRVTANRVYVIKSGLARGLRRKGGLGFVPRPLSAEEQHFQGLDLRGKTVYDVGGHEGVFALFFARAVGESGNVVCFEPNPENHGRLLENVQLNGFQNVRVLKVALGSRPGKASLVTRAVDSGFGSLKEELKASMELEDGHKTFEVELDTMDHQISALSLPPPDFVKIDVEGFELEVLQGMTATLRDHKPAIHMELHGLNGKWMRENAGRVVDLLVPFGYSIRHLASGEVFSAASRGNLAALRWGHFWCTQER